MENAIDGVLAYGYRLVSSEGRLVREAGDRKIRWTPCLASERS